MKFKVIIVEDDHQIAEIQKRFIQRIEGFELVGISHNLREAEDLIEVFNPHLILLDVQFPSGTGLDLLRYLRASNSNIDVILITAAKEVRTLQEALRGGVFDYILKPLVFERLEATLMDYKEHAEKIYNIEPMEQGDIDSILPRKTKEKHKSNQAERPPKGIDILTLDKIRGVFLGNQNPVYSAEEVGELIGASRTTARRYLEYLASRGDLSTEINYGSIGRPERKYTRKS
jgi:two-component system CitB family response regulator